MSETRSNICRVVGIFAIVAGVGLGFQHLSPMAARVVAACLTSFVLVKILYRATSPS